MSSFWRLLKYLKFYKGKVVLSILFYLLTALLSTVSIALLWPFLTILFQLQIPETEPTAFNLSINGIVDFFKFKFIGFMQSAGQTRALFYVCIVIVVVFFLKNLFRYLATYTITPVRNSIIYNLRRSIYDKILDLPLVFFSERRKGDIIARTTSDLKEIEISILNVLQALFKEPLMILFAISAMLFINARLTLFVFVLLAFTAVFIGWLGRTLKRRSRVAQSKLGTLLSIIEETLSGLRIIKAFNANHYQTENFDRHNASYMRTMNRILWRKDLSSPLSEFLGITVFVLLLWFGANMVFSQDLDAPTFFVFLGLFQQIINPAKTFSSAYYNVQKGIAAMERVDELLDREDKLEISSKPIPLYTFKDSIEFKNVAFSYPTGEEVLHDVNLKVEKGKSIALVGYSGSGKSTLVDLIPRFHDVSEGHILLDGIDIRKYNLKHIRSLIGIVTQESILFHDTIFNNIAFGIENPTQSSVELAARIANAHDFIMSAENGYETIVGDRGDKLSGGEKQRLTIARAVLRDPEILILDEATASLDSVSEKVVQDALFKLMENRTSIVIAHRLSTIKHVDEIAVIHDGTIIERGSHVGLMRKKGAYRELVDLQAF